MKWLLALFVCTQFAHAEPLTAFGMAKVEKQVREQLSCLGCHRLGDDGGLIGPDLSSIGERRTLAQITASLRAPVAPMPKITWRPGQLAAVAQFISQQRIAPAAPSRAHQAGLPKRESTDRSGAGLYLQFCADCHGDRGDGRGPNAGTLSPPPTAHREAALMVRRSDDTLFDGISGGGGVLGKNPRMPAFGGTLTALEIRKLVAHIRTLCQCTEPSWARDP